jgi:uncharacterized protein YxjI
MKFTVKQRIMAFGKQYRVMDEAGNQVYEVSSMLISVERRKDVTDMEGNPVAWAEWPVLTGQAELNAGVEHGSMEIPFMSLSPRWELALGNGEQYAVEGDFFRLDFSVTGSRGTVATIGKRLLAFSDTYEVEVDEKTMNPTFVLLLAALIDHKYHSDKN